MQCRRPHVQVGRYAECREGLIRYSISYQGKLEERKLGGRKPCMEDYSKVVKEKLRRLVAKETGLQPAGH